MYDLAYPESMDYVVVNAPSPLRRRNAIRREHRDPRFPPRHTTPYIPARRRTAAPELTADHMTPPPKPLWERAVSWIRRLGEPRDKMDKMDKMDEIEMILAQRWREA